MRMTHLLGGAVMCAGQVAVSFGAMPLMNSMPCHGAELLQVAHGTEKLSLWIFSRIEELATLSQARCTALPAMMQL